jgi:tetratricopeptide (TPR) repeat protein
MRRLLLVAVVVFVFIGSPAARGDDWPVARGPSHEPKPYQYEPRILRDVPREFLEDAPACILYARTSHLIEPDGTIEAVSHEITRFNGRKGIEKLGEYRSIYYNPRYDKLTLNEARVLKADGTSVPVEPRHVQLRDLATDYQVYDEDKQLVISWPNLQVGDAYEVKWTVRSKNPEFAGEFFTRYTFGDDEYPVVRDELYVRVPRGRTLKYASVNGNIEPTRTEARGQTHYHWKTVKKRPLPRDDDKPSREELRWQVACSTFPSWEAIGEWKQKLRAECWECTPAIKEVVARVAGDDKTPLEKARALTYWVRHNIRYLSRGPEGLGYTPHAPAQILSNRFGDCKDQAQLLAVMLREVGIPVWLVTLGTLDDGQVLEAVPSPWGTHAILLVELDGKEYWIDTTVSQAAWDFLPRSDCGRLAYLWRDGKVKLARTPEFTYKDYRIDQTTHLTIAPDGTSRSKREVSYQGTSAWFKRDAWIDAPLGERRRLVTTELQESNNRARLLALKVDEKSLHEFDGPVRAEVEFETPDHFAGDPHEGSLTDSVVWSRLLSYTFDPGRETPVDLHVPFESMHRFIVELPAALRCTQPPEEKKVQSPWGLFELKVDADPNQPHRLELRMHTRLEKTRIDKGDLAAFERFHDDVAKAYRVWLTLRPTRELADAPALEALLAAAPNGDPYSAKVLARLYLDHGKSGQARRVLATATRLSPGDQALWDLRLQATDPPHREMLLREMIQKFPKEGPYVAALGAHLVEHADYAEARKVLLPLAAHATAAVRGAAHYQLARACSAQGQFKEALKHLDAAVEADVVLLTDVKALDFKARVHEKLGEVNEAIETYRLALEIDEKAHDLLYPLVRLEWQDERKADALDHLRRYTVAAGRDKDRDRLIKAADLHLLLGRADDALELAERALAIKGDFPASGHRVFGLAHLRRKEYGAAAHHLELADITPQTTAGLIETSIALGKLTDAALFARRIAGFAMPDEDLRSREARVGELVARRDRLLGQLALPKDKRDAAASALGKFVCAEYLQAAGWPREQVQTLLQQSLKQMDLGPALALRGWLALEKGQLGKALADAEKAIARKPADPRAYLVRGRVRLERGDARALDDLQEAAQLSERKDAIVLHWLAAAQAQAGQVQLALQTQRQAVEIRPNDPDLDEQLRQLEKRINK